MGDVETFGSGCVFESRNASFAQLGINLNVLEPGQPNCLYHSESQQEAFLVLSGECKLLVEGEERLPGPWDFVHCPAGTEHVFVGAGDGPCVILMTGARSENEEVLFPVSELAPDTAPARRARPPTRNRLTRRSSGHTQGSRRTGTASPGPSATGVGDFGREDREAHVRLVGMDRQRLLLIALALGLLLLALGGWLVQALRWPSRSLVAPVR